MPRAGLRSIPSGSNPVVAARSNGRTKTVQRRFTTDGVPGQRASRAPASARRSRARGHVRQRRSSKFHALLIGPSPARCTGARDRGHRAAAHGHADRLSGQCGVFTNAREARWKPSALAMRAHSAPPGARALRTLEDRMATGRRRLNHRSTSGWTLARHAGCHAALLLHRLTAHSSLMRINLVPRIGFFLGHV